MSKKKPKIEFSESQKVNITMTTQKAEDVINLVKKNRPKIRKLEIDLEKLRNDFINIVKTQKGRHQKILKVNSQYLLGRHLPVEDDYQKCSDWLLDGATQDQKLEYDNLGLTENLFFAFIASEVKRKDDLLRHNGIKLEPNEIVIKYKQQDWVAAFYYAHQSEELPRFECFKGSGTKIKGLEKTFEEFSPSHTTSYESNKKLSGFYYTFEIHQSKRFEYLEKRNAAVKSILKEKNWFKALNLLEKEYQE